MSLGGRGWRSLAPLVLVVMVLGGLLYAIRPEPSPDRRYSSDPFFFITQRDGKIGRDEYPRSPGSVSALNEAEQTALCWAKNAYEDLRLTLNSQVRIVDSPERTRAAELIDSTFKDSAVALAVEDYRTRHPDAARPDIRRAMVDAGYSDTEVSEGMEFLDALSITADAPTDTSYVVFEVAATTQTLRVVRLRVGTVVNSDHRTARLPPITAGLIPAGGQVRWTFDRSDILNVCARLSRT